MKVNPLVVHTVALGEGSPEALLDAPGSSPRGFFADDQGATAWLGAARSLTAEDLQGLSAQEPGAWSEISDAPPSLRAFVVARFSLDPRERADPAWRDTPGARWVLPRLSVTQHNGALTARWLLPPGELPPTLSLPALSAPAPANVHSLDEDRPGWNRLVAEALDAMSHRRAEKLVAARRVALRREGGWRLSALLRALDAHRAPGGVRFAFSHEETTLLGATPETLLLRDGAALTTEALAGSLPRDPLCDPRDREALLGSEKDRREHEHVRRMILHTIAPWCAHVDAPAEPVVRSLRTLHHLCTPVRATLRPEAPRALGMAAALHPTPAVAGVPVAESMAWIRAHEPHPRGWYAGAVGWCDARGDGQLSVAIRSAVIRGERAWIYAGAGLVPGSDPEREWRETAVKMSLMREVLGG